MTLVRGTTGSADHWDRAYRHGDSSRSWFQATPAPSLRILDRVGATADDSVIDVGGGASSLVDALLGRGYSDLTVLDISGEALHAAQRRLGARADQVDWQVADLLRWNPIRNWAVWHDRAVLHFFTSDADRAQYVRALHRATVPGSRAVLAAFAPDGPSQCSGLPVARYDSQQLSNLLGERWRLLIDTREEHTAPSGAIQPFTWTAFLRCD